MPRAKNFLRSSSVIKFLPNRSSLLTLCRGQRKVNAKEPIEQNHNVSIAFQIGLAGRWWVSLNFFLLCHGSRKFKLTRNRLVQWFADCGKPALRLQARVLRRKTLLATRYPPKRWRL